MEANPHFTDQVRLLLAVLPVVAKQKCFALKGGTAINLFLRNMPRLSVDIDLAYLPIEDRETSLRAIDAALGEIESGILRQVPRTKIKGFALKGTNTRFKLLVNQDNTSVKIEVTPVLRGSVYPAEYCEVSSRVATAFGFARVLMLSFEDLYAGKICAALDRQHPRDLYDVHWLLSTEGIGTRLKNAFLVYLMGHNRPMTELLAPNLYDLRTAYKAEFEGLTYEPVPLDDLSTTLENLIDAIHQKITDDDRRFLLSFKQGNPDWEKFPIPEVARLPSIQWKMLNLRRMDSEKRRLSIAKLEKVLSINP